MVRLANEVFDDDVSHFFWSGEMERTYQNTLPLIRDVQSLLGGHDTYVELVKVAKRPWLAGRGKLRKGGARWKDLRFGGAI
jgi:hypothetical protein